jgi:hypothetical protein
MDLVKMKTNNIQTDNLLLIIAVIAVVVSVVGAGLTYGYLASFKNKFTGFATDAGTVNLTVESVVSVNFTVDAINWGSGMVNAGQDNATLNTAGGATNVTNGNWTGNTAGFIIENIGNKNATINFSFGKDAAGLIGGGSPSYEFNVSNQAGFTSCFNSTGGASNLTYLGRFMTANTTMSAICPSFPYTDGNDTLRVDIKIVIPSDSKTGVLTDTITATFVQGA